MMNKFDLGYYHGFNGFLVSDQLANNPEYISGYSAGMKAEDEKIEHEYKRQTMHEYQCGCFHPAGKEYPRYIHLNCVNCFRP